MSTQQNNVPTTLIILLSPVFDLDWLYIHRVYCVFSKGTNEMTHPYLPQTPGLQYSRVPGRCTQALPPPTLECQWHL